MIESFVFSSTIEGYEFKPGAQPGTLDFSNNILALQEKSDSINASDPVINTNYNQLFTGVRDLSSNWTSTYAVPKYRDEVLPDKTDRIKTTTDVRNQDINVLLLQQNYIYIVGSITCATLLIAAVIIGKE